MPKPQALQTRSQMTRQRAKPRPNARPGARTLHGGLELSSATKIPLVRAPMPMARRFMLIVTAVWAEACADESLDHFEFPVLGMLLRAPETDRNGLAAIIGVDRTNIGLIIDRLEKRGFLERSVNPEDRRAQRMRVTPAGKEACTRQTAKTALAREKILAPLTAAERKTLYDLLERVIAANERYSIPGAGRRKRSL